MDHNGAGPPGPISVFLADDNLIVREGVRALINARRDLRGRRGGRRLRRARQRRRGHPAAGARHRHPDAADLPARGHRRRPGGAQAPSRHRGRGAVPVRGPRVRGLAAGRGLGRLRLPAEGPGRRGQPARRRDPGGGDRRHRPGPVDRRGAGRPGGPGRAACRPPRRSCSALVAEGKTIKAIAAARGVPPEAVADRGGRGLRQAGPGRVRGQPERAAAAAHAPPGHRRPGGTGRDTVPAAAQRPGREAPAGAAGHRRDRAGRW